MTHPTTHTITSAQLLQWLQDGQELAVLDLRSIESFGKGQPLFATNLPAARLLAEIHRFVPRRAVRTVLVDGGDSASGDPLSAAALAARLADAGWPDMHALAGGVPAWLVLGAGLPTFDTAGVSFSLAVRDAQGTPVIDAAALQAARQRGEDVLLIDTRTLPEYAQAHVPGAVGVPGAELLLRLGDLLPSAHTQVVVSCAGLPRAILGAQTLIDAGVPNPVAYLDDGTAGWVRAGLPLEQGATRVPGPASAGARTLARRLAERLAQQHAFPLVDADTARRWQADAGRTTYVLDVRTPAEFAAGHLPGSLSSEGGQLLGVAHRTIAVRGARVVLVDDLLGARARVTAHWLHRRGYEIALLLHDFGADAPATADRAAAEPATA
jgi:rhodanese-related sulfurtransferase